MWDVGRDEMIRDSGLDAYFFQRYLRTMTLMFAPVAGIVAPVLIALNYSGGSGQDMLDGSLGGGPSSGPPAGLDTLAWGNITRANAKRYWVHFGLAEVVIFWVSTLLHRELAVCASIRQSHLTSNGKRVQQSMRTVLVGSVPTRISTDMELVSYFRSRCGGVKNAWLIRDVRPLTKLIELRDHAVRHLEKAETELMIKAQSNTSTTNVVNLRIPTTLNETVRINPRPIPMHYGNQEYIDHHADPAGQFVAFKDRPRHRVARWGLPSWLSLWTLGPKKSTIGTVQRQILGLNRDIDSCLGDPPLLTRSAVVFFKNQAAAQQACQLLCDRSGIMTPRLADVNPEDVIWQNTGVGWLSGCARRAIVNAVLSIMVIFWAVPVAWIAALANIESLSRTLGLLRWLRDDKRAREIAGVLAGILPPAILSLVLAVMPCALDFLGILRGARTRAQQASFVQRFYFGFLFVQVFLVVSVASFFSASVGQTWRNIRALDNIEAVASLLARNVPRASNYFFSHMALEALLSSAATLLRPLDVAVHLLRPYFVQDTPRALKTGADNPPTMNLSHMMPGYTVFACISLAYCIVAPLISFFAVALFGLAWISQTYNIVFVSRTSLKDSGVFYPRALHQTFCGLYILELLLMGLFLSQAVHSHSARVQSSLMLATLGGTVLYQVSLRSIFNRYFTHVISLSIDEDVDNMPETGPSPWEVSTNETWRLPSFFKVAGPTISIPQDDKYISRMKCREARKLGLQYTDKDASLVNGSLRLREAGGPRD
jgi:hypothetical protein